MCWFGHVQKKGENRIVYVGLDMYREWKEIELCMLILDMYREWKEIELFVLVWTCTENGRK